MNQTIAMLSEDQLKAKQSEISAELAEIKHRMKGSGRIPDAQYHQLSRRRADLVRIVSDISARLAAFRSERRVVADMQHQQYQQARNAIVPAIIKGLLQLREIYRQQAMDPTRTDAVRFMSNQFQEQLTKVLEVQ